MCGKQKQGQITPFGGGYGSDNPLLKYMNMVRILGSQYLEFLFLSEAL